jgi:hypothetical protein
MAPVRDCIGTEAMLLVDQVGRYAAQDVVCKVYYLLYVEFTLLKP